MFGLPFYRHRAFETNWFWMQPGHVPHQVVIGGQSVNLPRRGETFIHPKGNGAQKLGVAVGHAAGWRIAAAAMNIDWMKRAELTQAIPPAYCEFIGAGLLRLLETKC